MRYMQSGRGLSRTDGATAADYRALVQRLTAAFSQMIERTHARGIRIHGATIMPMVRNEPEEIAAPMSPAW